MRSCTSFDSINFYLTIILASGFFAILSELLGSRMIYAIMKPLTTICIISLFIRRTQNRIPQYYHFILVGLFACLVGDTLLLYESLFVYGLGSFLIAHLCFIRAFCSIGGLKRNPLVLVLLSGIAGVVYWLILPNLGHLSAPVAVYVVCIVVMAWQGIGLAMEQKRKASYMIAIAAVLFMFSDSMIAVNNFLVSFQWSGVLILTTYWLSISLISRFSNSVQESQNALVGSILSQKD